MLVVVVLLATVLLRFSLVAVLTYVLLPRGPTCPHCAAELTQIRNTFLRRPRKPLASLRIELRRRRALTPFLTRMGVQLLSQFAP